MLLVDFARSRLLRLAVAQTYRGTGISSLGADSIAASELHAIVEFTITKTMKDCEPSWHRFRSDLGEVLRHFFWSSPIWYRRAGGILPLS